MLNKEIGSSVDTVEMALKTADSVSLKSLISNNTEVSRDDIENAYVSFLVKASSSITSKSEVIESFECLKILCDAFKSRNKEIAKDRKAPEVLSNNVFLNNVIKKVGDFDIPDFDDKKDDKRLATFMNVLDISDGNIRSHIQKIKRDEKESVIVTKYDNLLEKNEVANRQRLTDRYVRLILQNTGMSDGMVNDVLNSTRDEYTVYKDGIVRRLMKNPDFKIDKEKLQSDVDLFQWLNTHHKDKFENFINREVENIKGQAQLFLQRSIGLTPDFGSLSEGNRKHILKYTEGVKDHPEWDDLLIKSMKYHANSDKFSIINGVRKFATRRFLGEKSEKQSILSNVSNFVLCFVFLGPNITLLLYLLKFGRVGKLYDLLSKRVKRIGGGVKDKQHSDISSKGIVNDKGKGDKGVGLKQEELQNIKKNAEVNNIDNTLIRQKPSDSNKKSYPSPVIARSPLMQESRPITGVVQIKPNSDQRVANIIHPNVQNLVSGIPNYILLNMIRSVGDMYNGKIINTSYLVNGVKIGMSLGNDRGLNIVIAQGGNIKNIKIPLKQLAAIQNALVSQTKAVVKAKGDKAKGGIDSFEKRISKVMIPIDIQPIQILNPLVGKEAVQEYRKNVNLVLKKEGFRGFSNINKNSFDVPFKHFIVNPVKELYPYKLSTVIPAIEDDKSANAIGDAKSKDVKHVNHLINAAKSSLNADVSSKKPIDVRYNNSFELLKKRNLEKYKNFSDTSKVLHKKVPLDKVLYGKVRTTDTEKSRARDDFIEHDIGIKENIAHIQGSIMKGNVSIKNLKTIAQSFPNIVNPKNLTITEGNKAKDFLHRDEIKESLKTVREKIAEIKEKKSGLGSNKSVSSSMKKKGDFRYK